MAPLVQFTNVRRPSRDRTRATRAGRGRSEDWLVNISPIVRRSGLTTTKQAGAAGMLQVHAMIGEQLDQDADEFRVSVGGETDRSPWQLTHGQRR